MHPNPSYRKTATSRSIAFARERAFGVLTVSGPAGPLVSHVPFVLNEDGTRLEAHLVRSNPIVRLLSAPVPVLVAVIGPDGYVSPDWYQMADQVPTWNYVAVHLRGTLEVLEPAALPPHLGRLSAQFEERLLPKQPWTDAKVDPEALARLHRMIVPVAMQVDSIDSTWKLSQNKTPEVRLNAAAMVEAGGIGSELAALAALMQDPPDEE